jgi:hypothetical protein
MQAEDQTPFSKGKTQLRGFFEDPPSDEDFEGIIGEPVTPNTVLGQAENLETGIGFVPCA